MVVPGTTRPLESRTMPVTVADVDVCARAEAAPHIHTIASQMAGDRNLNRMKQTPPAGQQDPPFTVNGSRCDREARREKRASAVFADSAVKRRRGVSGAGRWRFGTVGAEDRGPRRAARKITKFESVYGWHQWRRHAKAASQRDD